MTWKHQTIFTKAHMWMNQSVPICTKCAGMVESNNRGGGSQNPFWVRIFSVSFAWLQKRWITFYIFCSKITLWESIFFYDLSKNILQGFGLKMSSSKSHMREAFLTSPAHAQPHTQCSQSPFTVWSASAHYYLDILRLLSTYCEEEFTVLQQINRWVQWLLLFTLKCIRSR